MTGVPAGTLRSGSEPRARMVSVEKRIEAKEGFMSSAGGDSGSLGRLGSGMWLGALRARLKVVRCGRVVGGMEVELREAKRMSSCRERKACEPFGTMEKSRLGSKSPPSPGVSEMLVSPGDRHPRKLEKFPPKVSGAGALAKDTW